MSPSFLHKNNVLQATFAISETFSSTTKYFIVFMTVSNTISGMFIYFINEYMAISRNLISNITIDTEKGNKG